MARSVGEAESSALRTGKQEDIRRCTDNGKTAEAKEHKNRDKQEKSSRRQDCR